MSNEINTDVFGQSQVGATVMHLDTDYSIVIELGKTSKDTKIKTIKGEELNGAMHMSINVDPEDYAHSVTIKFLNPKIVTK
jgi:hypothetical protein